MKSCNRQIIVGPLPPPIGGVSSAVVNLQEVFKNNQVDFDTFSTSSGATRENLYGKKEIRQYFRVFTTCLRFIRFIFINRNSNVCHLFVVSNLAFLRDLGLLLMLKIAKKKVVIHLHSKVSGEFFLDPRKIRFFGRAISLADVVFVLSEEHKKFFINYVDKSKLKILENYVDSVSLMPISNKNDEWLYVGRLSEMKGFFDLLEALDIIVNRYGFKKIVVNCLGVAETDERQALIEKEIFERGLTNQLRLHGVTVGERKNEFFKSCKGFVFPSRFENSPVVLKEAICSGMAIIASDIDANKNILDRDNCSKYFKVGNVESLVSAILELQSSSKEMIKLVGNAKKAFKYDYKYAEKVIFGVTDEL